MASASQRDGGTRSDRTSAKVVALAVAGAVGGFLFGFDSSVINGAVDAIETQFDLLPTLTGFAVASALIGCAIGAFIGGRLADRLGRTRVMLIAAVLFLVSAIGCGLAFAVWDLIVWRLVGGFGIGMASVVAPAYIAEIAPAKSRGKLGSLQQLAITIGIFAALLSDAVFANAAGGAAEPFWFDGEAWRWMFLAGAVPAVVYGVVALALPESPRYLVVRGREDEARRTIARIWGDDHVDAGMRDITKGIEADAESDRRGALRGSWLGLKPVVWIGIALSVFQQFVGINVIFYYSTTLWQAVGFEESDSFTISVITSVTNILVTFIGIALVDRVGRKPILLTGSAGMTVALGAMALAFSQATVVDGAPQLDGPWGPIALVAANLFVVCFGASWGPMVWVLLSEMFPNRIRAKALGVAAAAQWIANFVVTVSFPPMSEWSLFVTYGLYALFALLSLLFVAKFVPETKGVELEDAEALFAEKGVSAKR